MSNDSLYKTRELSVYLTERSAGDPRFGRVKLANLVFVCDFGAYARFGDSLTGARYRRHADGPVSDEQLLLGADLVVDRDADVAWLAADRLAFIGSMVDGLRGKSGIELRDLARVFPGYELAAPGEKIPYHAVFISREAPTQEDLEWGLSVSREHQLA
jgi:hypothetical protein